MIDLSDIQFAYFVIIISGLSLTKLILSFFFKQYEHHLGIFFNTSITIMFFAFSIIDVEYLYNSPVAITTLIIVLSLYIFSVLKDYKKIKLQKPKEK